MGSQSQVGISSCGRIPSTCLLDEPLGGEWEADAPWVRLSAVVIANLSHRTSDGRCHHERHRDGDEYLQKRPAGPFTRSLICIDSRVKPSSSFSFGVGGSNVFCRFSNSLARHRPWEQTCVHGVFLAHETTSLFNLLPHIVYVILVPSL